jgi:hypothetical protein
MMQDPWGYGARPSQASRSITNTVRSHVFAKPFFPTLFLMFFEA